MMPLVGLVATACLAQVPMQTGYGAPSNVSNVQFRTISSGTDATRNAPGLYLFNDPTAWESYWRENHRGRPPVLEPGFFRKWRLLAIHTGNRPTGGYGIGVQRMIRRIDRATIYAIESVPPRGARYPQSVTSPWTLLQVEMGAFDFAIQTQQFASYNGATTLPGGSTVRIGGATVTFGPGYSTCDHCHHRGRGNCQCDGGPNCDCDR